MAGLLAQRDQENLTYGHQTTAAAKPLNQGTRALAPKTPGNKPTKTPLRVPLRDENNIDAGKTGLKKSNGNENLLTEGKKSIVEKNAFVTPLAPKSRAPLGQKTTNAKAKPFQTPGLLQVDQNAGKSVCKSVSARKPKPRVSHTEPAKIDLLEPKDEEEPEIEYMPPRPKDLPDYPDDIDPNINFSMLKNGGLRRDFFDYLYNHKGFDGLSANERDELRSKRADERYEAENQAYADYILDDDAGICLHEPDCPTRECKDAPEVRRKAKEKYDQKLAEIDTHFKSLPPIGLEGPAKPAKAKKQVDITKGPTADASKRAASTLSMSKPRIAPTAKSSTASKQQPSALVSRPKKPTQPTNPSSMRHTAAVAASNTTMGYSKGRAASASLRQARAAQSGAAPGATVDPNSLSPEEFMRQYGAPAFMSDMWRRCRRQGLIEMPGDEEREERRKQEEREAEEFAIRGPDGKTADDYFQEEAERDFEIRLAF